MILTEQQEKDLETALDKMAAAKKDETFFIELKMEEVAAV